MKKCVTIYFNIAISDEILETLRANGVTAYSMWPRMTGNGPVTGPRLDSHVWPGANAGIQTVLDENLSNKLMDALQVLRNGDIGRDSGLYAFVTPVERVLEG